MPTRVREVVTKLWRLQDTKILWIRTLIALAIGFGELCLSASKPCLMSRHLYDHECEASMFWLIVVVLPFKGVATSALLQYQLLPSANYAMARQAKSLLAKSSTSEPVHGDRTLGWAAASSLSVFKGVVKVTARSQITLLWQIAVSTLLVAITFSAGDLEISRSQKYQAYGEETCGSLPEAGLANQHMCWFAWKFKDVIAIVVSNSFLYVFVFTMMIRKELWSPVFSQALEEQGVRWLQRSLWLHWSFLPMNLLILYVFIVNIRIIVMKAAATEMIAFVWASTAYSLVFVFLVCWSIDIDGVMRQSLVKLFGMSHRRPKKQTSSIFNRRPTTDAGTSPEQLLAEIDNLEAEDEAEVTAAVSTLPAKDASADSSFRHRQVQLLACVSVLFVLVPLGSWWTFASVWLARGIALWMSSRSCDRHCTFSDLQRTDATYGLLLDADQLREVIEAYLEGKPCPHSSVRTVRGTFYRMDDTMTVSYRWQGSVIRLCPGVALNMSSWQLAELVKAITETKCLYVWLDKQALPQKHCKLQQTILARMMAVYATSKVTLALRSLEADGDRYHQRAWTLQEYCNARSLIIVTQEMEGKHQQQDIESMQVTAVARDEEELFPEIRAWHQSRINACCPLWLMETGELPRIDMKQAAHWLNLMGPRLVCKFPLDKIRALYPMIFNIPCENQADLVNLLKIVTDQPGGKKRRKVSFALPVWTKEDAEAIRAIETESVPDFDDENSPLRHCSSDFFDRGPHKKESVKMRRYSSLSSVAGSVELSARSPGKLSMASLHSLSGFHRAETGERDGMNSDNSDSSLLTSRNMCLLAGLDAGYHPHPPLPERAW